MNLSFVLLLFIWGIGELDFEGVGTPIGPSGPYFELIYHNDRVYEGSIGS